METVFVVWDHFHEDDYKRADSYSSVCKVFREERASLIYAIVMNVENESNDLGNVDVDNISSTAIKDWIYQEGDHVDHSLLQTMTDNELRECLSILIDNATSHEAEYTMRCTSHVYSVVERKIE
jgi:hypothetical protein